jgi:hypothetical protein
MMATTSSASSATTPPSRSSGPASDPGVAGAFALGWNVALLYHLRDLTAAHLDVGTMSTAPSDTTGASASTTVIAMPTLASSQALADLSGLAFPDRVSLLKQQIDARAERLLGAGTHGLPTTLVVDGGELSSASRAEVTTVHIALLKDLTVADSRLGKAYSLGTQLAETCVVPYFVAQTQDEAQSAMQSLCTDARIERMKRHLWDLKSMFQPYATDAVGATLVDWGKWVGENTVANPSTFTRLTRRGKPDWAWAARRLYRQSGSWRALLSGEETSTDTLQVSDYLDSAAHIASRFLRLVRGTLWKWKAGFLGVTLLAAGFAVAAGFLINQFGNHLAGVAAAVVALLGSFGITGATVAAAVKRAASRVEKGLLEAELAAAVALAINLVPGGTGSVTNSAVEALHDGSSRDAPRGPAKSRRRAQATNPGRSTA